jgi:CBS domain-containing protein
MIGINQAAELAHAAKLMVERNIGALGVYSPDGQHLVGIITERDLMRSMSQGKDPERTPVVDYMSKKPLMFVGRPTKTVAERLMKDHGVRHLIVIDDDCDRILSLRDI